MLLKKAPHAISSEDLHSIAARAHGYVGADLSAVVREAGTLAIKRWLSSQALTDTPPICPSPSSSQPQLTHADLLTALPSVRPSALRSLFLDTTPVHWADIGGQASTIARLRECVEWPLLHPDAFARLGVRAPKGVLLYGPPGCSKTLLVRACATESGVNFLAVKGPEVRLGHAVVTLSELNILFISCLTSMWANLSARYVKYSARRAPRHRRLYSS